jgi:hypothetical protein
VKSSTECVNPRRLDHFKLGKVITAVVEITDVNDCHVSSAVFDNIVYFSLEIVPWNEQVYHPTIDSTAVSKYCFYLLACKKLLLDQLYLSCYRSLIDKLDKSWALILNNDMFLKVKHIIIECQNFECPSHNIDFTILSLLLNLPDNIGFCFQFILAVVLPVCSFVKICSVGFRSIEVGRAKKLINWKN